MTQVQIGAAVEANSGNPTRHLGKCGAGTQVQTGAEDKSPIIPKAVLTFIAAARWKRTQHVKPHEYTHRDWGDVEGFYEFIKLIRAPGYDAKFQGRKYRYLDVGEFTYWTMGMALEITIIINRRRTEDQSTAPAPTARPAKRRGRVSYPTDSGRRLCGVTIQPSVGRLIGEPNQNGGKK